MASEPIASGTVAGLCINGEPRESVMFLPNGPYNDKHRGFERKLSGHDGVYRRTSLLEKGDRVFNWRTWTGLSKEEIVEVERSIKANIPRGILQENLVVSGIPNFSRLPPTSRLVFPEHKVHWNLRDYKQVILAVWEENSPCRHVGEPLEKYHGRPGLMAQFIEVAQHKRGVTGFVLSGGRVNIGDKVIVYPPVV